MSSARSHRRSPSSVLFFFVLLPAALTAIFFLPQDVKDSWFVLRPQDLSPPSIFLSHYTHSDLSHLLGNLLGYYLVILLIFNIEVDWSFFLEVSAVLLLFLPLILSLAQLAASGGGSSQGFSGILSGFYGYSLFSVYRNLKSRIRRMDESFPIFIFSLNALAVAALHGLLSSIIVLGPCLLLALLARESLKGALAWIGAQMRRKRSLPDFLRAVFLFSLACFALFQLPFLLPTEVVMDGKVINVVAHYLGYVFGFFFPLLVRRE